MFKLMLGTAFVDFDTLKAAIAWGRSKAGNMAWIVYNDKGEVAFASHRAVAFVG